MNKKQLSAKIYERLGGNSLNLSKKDIYECITEIFNIVQEALLNDERVKISGFGTLMVKTRKPKKGMNLKENKIIDIPERKVVVFKPSKSFIRVVE